MSTETEAKKPESPEAAAAPKKPSAIGGLLKVLVPALLAAGAAYGGSRVAAAHGVQTVIVQQVASSHGESHKPPGPTLPLEPFLVSIQDANKKAHPMKMSIAVEFRAGEGGGGEHGGDDKDAVKTFVPRIRDGVLAQLRTLSYEQATDPAHAEKLRTELLERCKHAGAENAERILVTDLVVQ